MGLLSSRSSTNVSNQYLTETNTQQTDNSGNQGIQNIGGSLSLSYTDGGAIQAAERLAGAGLDNAQAAQAGALTFGTTALKQVAELNSNSLGLLASLVSGA